MEGAFLHVFYWLILFCHLCLHKNDHYKLIHANATSKSTPMASVTRATTFRHSIRDSQSSTLVSSEYLRRYSSGLFWIFRSAVSIAFLFAK